MNPRRPLTYTELLARNGSHRLDCGHRRTLRGVWAPENAQPRSAAAVLEHITVACPHAVATGWLAAAIHGHPWADRRTRPYDIATGTRQVRRPHVRSRHYAIPEAHVERLVGPGGTIIRVASPDWTVLDLARLPARDVDALVALDGASEMMGADPRLALPPLMDAHPGYRGYARTRRRLERCRPLAESPRETCLRVLAEDAGIEGLVVQYRVPGLPYRIDLALPEELVAIEYDGAGHRDAAQHAKDVRRWNALLAAGWYVIPVTSQILDRHPDEFLLQLAAGRAHQARAAARSTANLHLPPQLERAVLREREAK